MRAAPIPCQTGFRSNRSPEHFHHTDGRYHWHLDRAVPVYGSRGELLRFVGTCADIDELKQAEERNKGLLEVSSTLNSVLYRPLSAHFSSSRSSIGFSAVCKAVSRVIALDWAELALYEPRKDTFQALVTLGKQNEGASAAADCELRREGNSLGCVFDSCLPLFRVDLQREQQYADERRLAAAGMGSYAVPPLLIDGKCTGVLAIASEKPQHYSEHATEFLSEVAKQISLIVANLKAYEEIAFLKAKLEIENT